MISKPSQKPQLHSSHLNTLSRCGEQFRRVVLMGEKEPPGVALGVGSTVHKTVAFNLNHKIENKGEMMPIDQMKDFARDSFIDWWKKSPVLLGEDERAEGLEKVRGSAIDQSIELSMVHYKEIAPKLNPVAGGVERAWVIEAKGYPYDLAGTIDVDEGLPIRDTKTRNKLVGELEVQTSEQLTLYAMAKKIIDKLKVDEIPVWLDILVKPSAKLHARAFSFESKRSMADFKIFMNRFERAIEIIEKEAFTPTSRSNWWCSTRFCGFAANGSCPFFNGRKTFSFSKTQKQPTNKGVQNVRASIIKANTAEWSDACR